MKRPLLLLIASLFYLTSLAQDKCTQVLSVLDKVKDACQAYPPQDYCNIFVGQAISDLYQIDDFKLSSSPTGFYDANTLMINLFTRWSANWQNIGTCDKQDVLNQAQAAANSNKCVIAVWRNPNPAKAGHIALILPGQLKSSTVWHGLKAPNSANFAMNAANLNYVCDKLSGAFGPDKISTTCIFVYQSN